MAYQYNIGSNKTLTDISNFGLIFEVDMLISIAQHQVVTN